MMVASCCARATTIDSAPVIVRTDSTMSRLMGAPPGHTARQAPGLVSPTASRHLVWKSRNKPVAVRHPDFRQRLRVHHLVLANDLVEREKVRGERIDFVIGKRARVGPR